MINAAKIRVGLLGGRGYGKTVFLTKLISLADSSEDGFIQFDAGSEALQLKNLMLENDGRLPATAIKEISKYNFILGKQSGEKWRIQFCDYAGELLERIESDTSNSTTDKTASASSGESDSDAQIAEDYTANEGNIPYIRKIKRWLKRCDAVIVLFPVNISDKDDKNNRIYPLSEVNIFRQNVGLLLNIMQKDPVLSNRPVCLAINKWDLLTNGLSFDEIVKKEPFVLFKNQLSNICGKNFFCMAISAFGKHLANDPEKADPSGKPFQVSEMLLALAEKAEHARVVSIRDTIKRLPRFIGWPLYPLLLLKNSIGGITDARLQRLNGLLWKKYGIKFAVNAAISAGCAFVLICAAMIVSLGFEFKSMQHDIQKGFESPDQIARIERALFKPRYFRFLFRYSYWSLMSIGDLEKLFQNGKEEYNRKIFDDTEQYFKKRESEIVDNGLAPQIRKNRIDEVTKRIPQARERLTLDSPYREKLQKLTDRLAELSRNTQENESFDVAYHDWVNIQDECEKARRAVAFLNVYTAAKFPQRKTHIDSVAQQRHEIETRMYNNLFASLHREIYADDFSEKTDDYPERIKRAEARIREIKEARDRLPDSHLLSEYDSLIKEEESRISYLNKYGHFDVQVGQLLASGAAKEADIIQKINNFISENIRGYSERRAPDFTKLEERVRELNMQFMEEMQKKLSSREVAPDSSAKYDRQIELARKRIKIIRDTEKKLSEREHIETCNSLIAKAEGIISERRQYGPYEIALKKVYGTPEGQRIAEINRFLEKFPQSEYPAKGQDYDALARHRTTLEYQFLRDLEKRLPVRNPQAKWTEQVEIAQQTIDIIESERSKFPGNSEPWKKCMTRIKDEQQYIRKLEYNGKFDDAYEALLKNPKDDAYIRRIKDFIDKYDAKTYPDRATIIAQLKQEIESRELVLANELTLPVPDSAKWQEKADAYQRRIADIDRRIRFFLDGSKQIGRLTKFRRELSAKKKNVEHYGKFDDEYTKLIADLDTADLKTKIRLIDQFFQTYSLSDYIERQDPLTDCRNRLNTLDQKVRENTLNSLQKPQNADSDALDWETKIARMRIRIRICDDALEQLSKHSQYRQEFSSQIESMKTEIQAIENYKTYYQAYSDVESKSDLYKVDAIKKFVQKYRDQYPSPLPRYTIERLEKQKADCIARFDADLKSRLNDTKDSSDLPWAMRLKKAKDRLDALGCFVEATGADKKDDIKSVEDLISQAERHIDFEKHVYAITHFRGDDLGLFTLIYRFYSEYPPQEWENIRSKDYESVRATEKAKVSTIMYALKQELKQHQNMDSLDAAEENLISQQKIYCKYQAKLYRAIPEYGRLDSKISEITKQLETIRKAQRNLEQINDLLAEGKNKVKGKNEAVGAFLTGVSAFVREVPVSQIHPQIKEKYAELLAMRDKGNLELDRRMRVELAPYEEQLGNSLTDDDRDRLYNKIHRIRNTYLAFFSPESPQFNRASREYENSVKSQDRVKNETKIKDGLDELRAELNNSSNGTDVKLTKIKDFETLLGTVGEEKDFPRFRDRFDYVKKMKEALEGELQLAELTTDIDTLLKLPTDKESDVSALISKCNDYPRRLEPFVKNKNKIIASIAEEYGEKIKKAVINYQGIKKEWDLYRSVQSARKNFLEDPQDSSFSGFRDAVWKLQQHSYKNFEHEKEIRSWEENLNKINNVRIELISKFATFRANGSSWALGQLRQFAKKYLELGMKNNITDYVVALERWLTHGNVMIMLDTFDFRDTGFTSSRFVDVDFKVRIEGIRSPIIFDIKDISGKIKHNPPHSYFNDRDLNVSETRSAIAEILNNNVKVTFGNYNFDAAVGEDSVEFSSILSKGIDTGSCTIGFSAMANGSSNYKRGHVYIQFSWLPRLQ